MTTNPNKVAHNELHISETHTTNEPPTSEDVFNFISQTNSCLDELFTDSPYKHPLDILYIKERICGSHNIQNAEDFFVHTRASHISRFLSEIKRYLLNIPFKPGESYFLNDVYVDGESDTSNIEKISNAAYSAYTYNRPSIVLGERGSGKTASLLVYLYRNYTQLINEKVIWLRTDIHQLYDAWLQAASKEENLITLSEYLELFLAYVFCKYKDDDSRADIHSVMTTIASNPDLKMHIIKKATHVHKTEVNLSDEINQLSSNISAFENKDKNRNYLINEWVKNAQNKNNELQRQFKNAKNIAKAIQDQLFKQGYQVLFFVDGCDNVDVTKNYGVQLYNKFLVELLPLCFKKPQQGINHIVFMRPKTLGDIRSLHSMNNQGHDDITPFSVELTPTCCDEISKQRFSFILNESLSQHDEPKYRPVSTAINKLLCELKDSRLSLHTRLSINHNIRDYLHNRLSLIVILSYVARIEKSGQCQLTQQQEIKLRVNTNSWSDRNKFLNGKLYLNSKMDGIETSTPGCIYFNPFSSPPTYAKWNGLMYLRLYQTIKRLNTAIQEHLVCYITTLFGYDKKLVDNAIEICETFGLVDIHHEEYSTSSFRREIKLNDKFDYFIELTFKDADILYYLALDTYLPEKIYREDTFTSHINKMEQKSYYNDVMPLTTLAFIRFLVIQDRLEKEGLEQKLSTLLEKNKNLSLDMSDFNMPLLQQQSYIHFIKRILHANSNASPQAQEKFKQLFEMKPE
ncbi:hypothetical protein [Flocculibacter collagenilyticus]|uniref:hypothetical protein n=1 Tax=Flocculibacter collagenilyticus TaxID=2744479 RepID=UPI0018F50D89|nr:hypothetical protein [Flocculibacter collagenilyticus]